VTQFRVLHESEICIAAFVTPAAFRVLGKNSASLARSSGGRLLHRLVTVTVQNIDVFIGCSLLSKFEYLARGGLFQTLTTHLALEAVEIQFVC